MKLKEQPKVTRGGHRPSRQARSRAGTRARGRGARRPGVPLRRRLSGRLPSIRRVLAGTGALALAALLVALVNGPWLRVTEVAYAGQRWTSASSLDEILGQQRGRSLLALDTRALGDRIERMPAVAEATVTASILGRVEAHLVERQAAFLWETSSGRFLGAADGTIFAGDRLDGELGADLVGLPRITDERFAARLITVGDTIRPALLRIAMRLAELDPATLGSTAAATTLRVDDEFGFRLLAADPGWEMAFGVYGLDPNETPEQADARLERQVTAVRTLFASEEEAGIGWVDVRNPGKVYFRAKG